ncbi:hypothetical protein ACP70R_046688 [Stipagrostis hirtigluma subsp. patula]
MACLHDHSCEDHNCAADWSLFNHIDIPKVVALNESVPGSVKSVFKPWEQRLDTSGGFLESNEDDPELLIFIPFTSDVKIKSISVVGGPDGTSPSRMRAFINREGIDFSDAQNMQPVQEWELAENLQGVLEYQTRAIAKMHILGNTIHLRMRMWPGTTLSDSWDGLFLVIFALVLRYSRFQGVANLTLHFSDNFGGDTTKIYYIGLRGEATQNKRDVVATIVYEVMPNPSEHKTKSDAGGGFSHVE